MHSFLTLCKKFFVNMCRYVVGNLLSWKSHSDMIQSAKQLQSQYIYYKFNKTSVYMQHTDRYICQ